MRQKLPVRALPALAGLLLVLVLVLVGQAAPAEPLTAPALPGTQPPPAAAPKPPASVPQPADHAPPDHAISLDAGAGKVITLSGAAASVFAADPKVVEVRPASPTSLFMFGVAPGRTTVAALDQAGRAIVQYDVTVRPSGFGAGEAQATIARLLPGREVHLQPTANGLIVTGSVNTAAEAEQVMAVARSYVPATQTVENRLKVMSGIQVGLRVRIAEMSRQVIREIGVNWRNLGYTGASFTTAFANIPPLAALPFTAGGLTGRYSSGGGFGIDGIIDALAQDNLVHVLAEPNLTAMSGETASFLVGGEFPIPIAQAFGQITVQFQPFGVQLAFVPTVLSSGRISLHVRPEVSELSTQGAVQLTTQANGGLSVPALTVRRAETTVELGSGQSFAIAGLLQDSITQTDNGLPGLGDLPILGALFRSESFQRSETELVIVVTPYIVRGVDDPAALRLPTDGYRVPNDLERILLMRQQARATPATPARIPGDAGFIIQ